MLQHYFLIFAFLFVPAFAQVDLEQYNIDSNTLTVSGLSSGGAFATQYHVIHSESIMGAAIFAGIVYHCANGVLAEALLCMDSPYFTNVNSLISTTENLADKGSIDPVTGMFGDKVYIFAGTEDTTVLPANGPHIETFYEHFGSDIKTVYDIQAEHCQPTDYYGPSCNHKGGDYINNCDYNGAYEALNYLYGGNLTRTADEFMTLTGSLEQFSQKEYFPLNSPNSYSMDNTGYIYVPQACVDKTLQCKLHVVFHGCAQGQEFMDDTFVSNTGYLQVADTNNIIMMFPQIIHEVFVNPNGCWDWWGYTGILNYVTLNGHQIVGINGMINRLVYGS